MPATVLSISDPGHAVTADLHRDPADFSEQFVLVLGPNDGVITLAQCLNDPLGPQEFVFLGPVLYCIADGAFQQRGVQLVFREVIGRSRFHGFQVNPVITMSRQENERCTDAPVLCFPHEIQPVSSSKPIVEQTQIVFVVFQRFQGGIIIGGPVHPAFQVRQTGNQLANQQEVIFVILDEKNSDVRALHLDDLHVPVEDDGL